MIPPINYLNYHGREGDLSLAPWWRKEQKPPCPRSLAWLAKSSSAHSIIVTGHLLTAVHLYCHRGKAALQVKDARVEPWGRQRSLLWLWWLLFICVWKVRKLKCPRETMNCWWHCNRSSHNSRHEFKLETGVSTLWKWCLVCQNVCCCSFPPIICMT